MHARATLLTVPIAESHDCQVVDGRVYFPRDSVTFASDVHSLTASGDGHKTWCPYKGEAVYFDVEMNGEKPKNVAWSYPEPKKGAERIRGFVAFYEPTFKVEKL